VERERIRLVYAIAVKARFNVKLVSVSGVNVRNEGFPDARLRTRRQRMRGDIPSVETSNDGNALGVGRPYAEPCARAALVFAEMTAEVFV
jgi:hypothetical protein